IEFLEQNRTLTFATTGRDGWPHLMPLWYVVRDGRIWLWTWTKSQKVRNLERDPRCTLQIEDGERYEELRGVMLRCRAVLNAEDDDGRLMGFLAGFLSQSRPHDAYVHFAGVAPEARGTGLGRELYERFFDAVRAAGRSVVHCVTSPVNEGSVAFHLAMGFEAKLDPK